MQAEQTNVKSQLVHIQTASYYVLNYSIRKLAQLWIFVGGVLKNQSMMEQWWKAANAKHKEECHTDSYF